MGTKTGTVGEKNTLQGLMMEGEGGLAELRTTLKAKGGPKKIRAAYRALRGGHATARLNLAAALDGREDVDLFLQKGT